MSFKAKDLQFDSSQPAFLQRLRGQLQSGDTARHEHPIARNKRMKKDDDEDDAPTYVMEETNQSLSKEEYEALVSGKDSKEKEGKEDESVAGGAQQNATTEAESRPKDKIAEVGGNAKKRKAAKIIGDDQGNSKDEADKDSEKPAAKTMKKSKKKTKAVKLTFGDEDEG